MQSTADAVLYWTVELSGREKAVEMSSIDPNLSSWYPFYVPFSNPVYLRDEDALFVQLRLLPIDAPYKYAIQLSSDAGPLSRILYW